MRPLAELTLEARMRVTFEAEQFLYAEAAILDERRFDDWLALLTDDVRYWMPIRRTTTAREVSREFTEPGDMAFFDDDRQVLEMRVRRLQVGRAWAEDPPSRTRRLISNVRVVEADDAELLVACNFQLYRTRLDSEEDSWIGRREDLLRRDGAELKLARRHIFLEQTVILSQNMSNLF